MTSPVNHFFERRRTITTKDNTSSNRYIALTAFRTDFFLNLRHLLNPSGTAIALIFCSSLKTHTKACLARNISPRRKRLDHPRFDFRQGPKCIHEMTTAIKSCETIHRASGETSRLFKIFGSESVRLVPTEPQLEFAPSATVSSSLRSVRATGIMRRCM